MSDGMTLFVFLADGWYAIPSKEAREKTGLTRKRFNRARENLLRLGYIRKLQTVGDLYLVTTKGMDAYKRKFGRLPLGEQEIPF